MEKTTGGVPENLEQELKIEKSEVLKRLKENPKAREIYHLWVKQEEEQIVNEAKERGAPGPEMSVARQHFLLQALEVLVECGADDVALEELEEFLEYGLRPMSNAIDYKPFWQEIDEMILHAEEMIARVKARRVI